MFIIGQSVVDIHCRHLIKVERNLLKLYGIDEGKWDLLRSIKTLDVNNKRYLSEFALNIAICDLLEISTHILNA